ncbi:hypothetical protein PSPO_b1352 [Pseudoalteromonas spongiae UST010723-006]|nr:hypothetical protein PSPO_b1352 [Pseudoalteromonas spongiae UST010723-006]
MKGKGQKIIFTVFKGIKIWCLKLSLYKFFSLVFTKVAG